MVHQWMVQREIMSSSKGHMTALYPPVLDGMLTHRWVTPSSILPAPLNLSGKKGRRDENSCKGKRRQAQHSNTWSSRRPRVGTRSVAWLRSEQLQRRLRTLTPQSLRYAEQETPNKPARNAWRSKKNRRPHSLKKKFRPNVGQMNCITCLSRVLCTIYVVKFLLN